MSRRNTIIIAVLVNAGLLLVLFATAMRSGEKKEVSPVQLAEAPKSKEVTSTPVTTEELLNEYIAAAAPEEGEEIIVLEDLVNGTTPITTSEVGAHPIVTAPVQQAPETSSLPAVQAKPVVAKPPVAQTKPVQAPLAQTSSSEVIVQKGDYLEKIAKANNTTVNALMAANHLSSSNLKIGQVLKIPGKEKTGDGAESVAPQSKDFYIVKEGDSPWHIASKCNIKLDALLRMNNIDEQKAKKLRPGDKLRIR